MQDLVNGRYRLHERIGSGGMAEVWRATDELTGRTVAVKRLHRDVASDPASRARFRREVDAARAVGHPSVVAVVDAGDGADDTWLAMDHLPGGSLADRVRRGPLAPEDVTAMGADLAGALAAVHAAGLVHRDVKPSNILLDASGRAYLADFGIARHDAPGWLDDVTATGDVVGTLRFLAPEVLAGAPAAAASDTWALGAVLHEALTGQPPWDASSPAALVASRRSLPARPPGAGDALADQLQAMLAPDPAARPAAREVAAALEAASPTVAGPAVADDDDAPTVVIPVASRDRSPLPPPAAELGGSAAGDAAPVPRTERARRRAPAGSPPSMDRRARVAVLAAMLLAVGLLAAINAPLVPLERAGVIDAPSSPAATSGPSADPSTSLDPAASAGPGAIPPVDGTGGKGKGQGKPGKSAKPGRGRGG